MQFMRVELRGNEPSTVITARATAELAFAVVDGVRSPRLIHEDPARSTLAHEIAGQGSFPAKCALKSVQDSPKKCASLLKFPGKGSSDLAK